MTPSNVNFKKITFTLFHYEREMAENKNYNNSDQFISLKISIEYANRNGGNGTLINLSSTITLCTLWHLLVDDSAFGGGVDHSSKIGPNPL